MKKTYLILSLVTFVLLLIIIFLLLSRSQKVSPSEPNDLSAFDNFKNEVLQSGKEYPVDCKSAQDPYECLDQYAIKNNDFEVCVFLPLKLLVDSCIRDSLESHSIQDSKYCELLDGTSKSLCYRFMAEINNDKALCLKTTSTDVCLRTIAFRLKKIEICNEIEDEITKLNCNAVLLENSADCLKLEGKPAFWESDCLRNIAYLKKDSSICTLIKDKKYESWCFAGTSGDISKCSGSGTFDNNWCIIETAVKFNKPDFCNSIDTSGFLTQDQKNHCYALVNRDVTYCDQYLQKAGIADCRKDVNLLKTNSNLIFSETMI